MSGTVWRAPEHYSGLGLPRNAPVLILDRSHQPWRHEDRSRHHRCVERIKKTRTTFLICHCWRTLGGCKLLLVIDQAVSNRAWRPASGCRTRWGVSRAGRR